MFYLRYYLYKLVKPFIKPLSPEQAIKYHYSALAFYVLISSNGAFLAYYFLYRPKELDFDDDEKDKLAKIKRKMVRNNSTAKTITKLDIWTGKVETEEFDLAKYREEMELKKRKKFEEAKKVALI